MSDVPPTKGDFISIAKSFCQNPNIYHLGPLALSGTAELSRPPTPKGNKETKKYFDELEDFESTGITGGMVIRSPEDPGPSGPDPLGAVPENTNQVILYFNMPKPYGAGVDETRNKMIELQRQTVKRIGEVMASMKFTELLALKANSKFINLMKAGDLDGLEKFVSNQGAAS